MLKQRVFTLLVLCAAIPAQAGLFSDDEARKQVQQVDARVQKLETGVVLKLETSIEQHTKSMLDLQSQIEALNVEIRKLRGQNEELAHGLQDAEKREKDFYVDLDARLRHFESAEEAAKEAPLPVIASTANAPVDPADPAPENRAYEAAYSLFKKGDFAEAAKAFQGFLGKYPESVYVASAKYWMGDAQLNLKDYKGALESFQAVTKDFTSGSKAADLWFNIATCQLELKQKAAANKSLKQLIAKYPASEAADKAKKLIANTK